MKFHIDMTDSPYSREDVEAALIRSFGFIQKFTGQKFEITEDEPTGDWREKVVRFGKLKGNIVALAKQVKKLRSSSIDIQEDYNNLLRSLSS